MSAAVSEPSAGTPAHGALSATVAASAADNPTTGNPTAGNPTTGDPTTDGTEAGAGLASDGVATDIPTDGRRARWVEHRETRRLELIQAAVDAIAEHGPNAGMEQIAAAAGTSKPVIYRYFADKAELFRAVVQQASQALVDRIRSSIEGIDDGRTALATGVRAYLEYIDDNRALYIFVVNHTAIEAGEGAPSAQTISEPTRVVGELAAAAVAARLKAIGVDPAYAQPWGLGMVGFVRNSADWWLDNPTTMTLPDLAEYITTVLWGGASEIGSKRWSLPARSIG